MAQSQLHMGRVIGPYFLISAGIEGAGLDEDVDLRGLFKCTHSTNDTGYWEGGVSWSRNLPFWQFGLDIATAPEVNYQSFLFCW